MTRPEHGVEPGGDADGLACTCAVLRRATRRVSQFYDTAMRPAGLKLSQFSLLVNISREHDQSLTALAERLAMERTTLTRNLRPLERDGLVIVRQGKDFRSRSVEITREGLARLETASPRWQEAECSLRDQLGEQRTHDLHSLLRTLARVSQGCRE